MTSGATDIVLHSAPDLEFTDFHTRVCAVQIAYPKLKETGLPYGLPCQRYAQPAAVSDLGKTDEELPFDDHGSVAMDRFCPAAAVGHEEETRQLTARIVYELPTQAPNVSAAGNYRAPIFCLAHARVLKYLDASLTQ